MLSAILFIVIFGRKIAPHDPYITDVANALIRPSAQYPFGTDNLGRCVFSRVLCGASVSILSALSVTAIIFVFGTAVGVISGYVGGICAEVLTRITTIFQAFPSFLLAVAVAGILGPSALNGIIALSFALWTTYARLSKSLVISITDDPYIKAAKLCGAKTRHIILRHIVPNTISPLVVIAALDVSSVILSMSGLAFLGLGAQRPTTDWGVMMSEARSYLQIAPWILFFPGITLLIVVITFNLFGDQLRAKLDAKTFFKNEN
jgi:ABC-type dipeptide/oligopeptide/nickel transport system permease subunit